MRGTTVGVHARHDVRRDEPGNRTVDVGDQDASGRIAGEPADVHGRLGIRGGM